MENGLINNINRFNGFADIYESARPNLPLKAIEIILKYLSHKPETVIDLGCGTGLSTAVWGDYCDRVIGIDANEEMLDVALTKQNDKISFKKALAYETGLDDNIADVVVCSQAFHWMEPTKTLEEINRLLKDGGVFAAIDYDWPPVCDWEVEDAFEKLTNKVKQIEMQTLTIKDIVKRWDKNEHLSNIKESGFFRFSREIVFVSREKSNSKRLINLALSMGGLQGILKKNPALMLPEVERYNKIVFDKFGEDEIEIDFCYRMRIGIK